MARTERPCRSPTPTSARLLELQRARRGVAAEWRQIVDPADLDPPTPRGERAAATLAAAAGRRVRLTAAYLAAFLTSELGRPVAPAQPSTRPLRRRRTDRQAARRRARADRHHRQAGDRRRPRTAEDAGQQGLTRRVRLAGAETLAPPRAALAT
jgi:hypothetical protein